MPPQKATSDTAALQTHGGTPGAERDRRQARRSNLNPQACNPCRQFKAKCNGARPACAQCLIKGRDCEYTGAPGQTRYQALQSKLLMFENLFQSLQTSQPADAALLLERIRTASPHEVSFLGIVGTDATEADQLDNTSLTSPSSAADPAKPILFEQSDSRPSLLTHLPLIIVPSIDFDELQKGIQGFFDFNASLFHPFSPAQVERLLESAKANGPGPVQRNAWCCLTAVAAVGHYYIDGTNDNWAAARPVYQYAKHLFEDLLEHEPLDALKVSLLMAMFNIMDNDMVALKYIEFGVTLSSQLGISQPYRAQKVSLERWLDCRRVWRTFIFFSSWLTSNLGHIATRSILTEPLPELSKMEVDQDADLSEVVQIELTNVAILESNVLRAHITARTVNDVALDSLASSLRSWYSDLPEILQLTNLGYDQLSPDIRHNLCYLHLLHLRVIMLHFRCIATYTATSDDSRFLAQGDEFGPASFGPFVLDAAVAATQSARIITLLIESRHLLKKCWLVIFQAYTACTILLYFTVQKKLRFGDASAAHDELDGARLCLDALTFTLPYAGLEKKFYRPLSEYYTAITGTSHVNQAAHGGPQKDSKTLNEQGKWPSRPAPQVSVEHTFTIPHSSDTKLADIARSLLDLLRLPVRRPEDEWDEFADLMNL